MQHELSSLIKDLRIHLQESYSPEERIYYSAENVAFLQPALKTKAKPPVSVPQQTLAATSASIPPKPVAQPKPPAPQRKPLPFTQPEPSATPLKEEKREVRLSAPTREQPSATSGSQEILQTIKDVFPSFSIIAPPQPEAPPVIALLKQGESGAELRFLHHIAGAIQSCFSVPCKVVTRTALNNASTTTRLIIAAEYRTHRETLPNIPFLPLSDLSLHMQNPALKVNLWSTICQHVMKYVHR